MSPATEWALLIAGLALIVAAQVARTRGMADSYGGRRLTPIYWIGYTLVGAVFVVLAVVNLLN